MNKKTMKKPLVLTTAALLLCIAMLLNTTFAWFTDNVTSDKNTIIAGNLDIEVTHSNGKVTGETIADSTDLFKDVELWEPGAVSYENFTITNMGTLALKYSFTLNPYEYNTLDGHNLSEVIKAKVLDDETFDGDRDDATSLTGYTAFNSFVKSGELAPGERETYAVVLYWAPGENDDLFNAKNGKRTSDGQPLFIDFGINVVATQNTVESDSFDNQYDAQAVLPVMAVTKIEAGKPTVLRAYDENNKLVAKAIVPADAVVGSKLEMTIDETDKPADITLNTGDEAMSYDVQFYIVDDNGVKTPVTDFGTANVVSVDLSAVLPTDATLKQVFHHHGDTKREMIKVNSVDEVTDGKFFYNETTHVFTVGSTTFSPFTFVTHAHTFNTTWTYDSTNHWHSATCEHSTEISAFGTHVFDDANDATCDCGYIRPIGISVSDITGGAVEMYVGDERTFTATTNPSVITYPNVTWSSSAESIATVDATGKVTALSKGEVTIKATADGKYADFTITVVKHVESVDITKATTTIAMGSTETLEYTVNPEDAKDKSVSWESSDTSVATVSSKGKVTPVANGTATITVKTTDGSYTDTCEVTVITNVTGVSIKETTTLKVGGTETLVATVAPETATDKSVTWSSSDDTTVEVDKDGKITAKKNGSATITVTTTDGSKTDTCTVYVGTDPVTALFNQTTATKTGETTGSAFVKK